jgi:hypothetical protein
MGAWFLLKPRTIEQFSTGKGGYPQFLDTYPQVGVFWVGLACNQ